MRSQDEHDLIRVQRIIDARRWQMEWLESYLQSGGTFYDNLLKREVGYRPEGMVSDENTRGAKT